jgi:DNA-binding response OmpR family regulator
MPKENEVTDPVVILYIDDEPTILTVRQIVLSKAGYKVLTAPDAESGLQLFIDNHVDLVITDQWLPGRSGGQIAAEMKQLKPEVPIILYTGLMDLPADAGRVDLVLTKAMSPEEFLALIAKLACDRSSGKKSDSSSQDPSGTER